MKRTGVALVIIWALLIPFAGVQAQGSGSTVLYEQDFSGDVAGWELEPGWELVPEGMLHGMGHTWARYVGRDFGANWHISFQLMLVRGRVHLIYRLNEQGRYFIGFEATRSDLHKQYWPDTFLGELAVAQAEHSVNVWHTVEIIGQGDRIQFRVDGHLEWEYNDPEPLLNGVFAFETIEESEVYIDNLVVTGPAEAMLPATEPEVSHALPPFSEGISAGSVTSAARLRAAPETGGAALATLSGGTFITILEETRGENVTIDQNTSDVWYHVQVGEGAGAQHGYIWAGLVERVPTWTRVGGPLGGLGYDIRMRPDNPDIMLVTDAWAGVFKSIDGGQTWFPSNNGILARIGQSGDAIPIFSLSIDPRNPDIVWAGTQNSRGIYRSEDGGESWQELVNGIVEYEGITFRGFTVHPDDSNIVYAAAELSSWVWSGQEQFGREFDMTGGVVYRTTDSGQRWTAIWRGENLARYIWIDPRDPTVIYLSTGIFDREAANSDPQAALPGGEGVLKSTDGGQTWQRANAGLENLYVGTLYMHPTNPDILLAGTGNNQYYRNAGIYLTTDGAQTWQQVLNGDNITAVEFATHEPSIAYAGSAAAIYRSTDSGQTWQTVAGGTAEDTFGWGPPGVRAGFPIDLQIDPRDPNRVFANNYGGGNFVSEDGGQTWAIASTGYTGAQVRDIAISADQVYAAARSGLFTSTDGGTTWEGLNTGIAFSLEWNAIALDPANPEHVLASNNWNGVLLQSFDSGRNWQMVGEHIGEGRGWRVITFAPSNPQVVYAGQSAYFSAGVFDDLLPAGGVWRSEDGGSTWHASDLGQMADANVTALAVDPQNPQRVYAATGNQGLLWSEDGGRTWTQNLNDLTLLSIVIDPAEPNRILVGLLFGGMRLSEDGGATWQVISSGIMPEASIADIVFDPVRSGTVYAADRMAGVYLSQDGGRTWQALNTGLRMRSINGLALSPDGTYLYAATEGGGLYRLDRTE